MELPRESASSWAHIASAAYLLASLRAWSEFPDLKPSEKTVLAGMKESVEIYIRALLKDARETEDQEIFGRPSAQANQNAWLYLLHRRMSEALTMVVLRLGGGSKDHPTVRAFLPNLMDGVAKTSKDDRPGVVMLAASRLETLEDFAEKTELIRKLTDAVMGTEAAIEAADAAWGAWTRERSEEMIAKGNLRLELERVYGQLKTLFPGQRSFVESFFWKDKSSVKRDEPTEPPTP